MDLEAFFSHVGDARCSAATSTSTSTSTTSDSDAASIAFLHGPPRAGLTSLLLQFGFTQAARGRSVVLVLCGSSKSEGRPATPAAAADTPRPVLVPLAPCARCGVPAQTGGDSLVWRRIQIKYIRSSNELQHFLCSFHLVKDQSSVLLVDALEQFFPADSVLGDAYQTLAFLYETLLYMQASAGAGQVVVTGASDSFILGQSSAERRSLRRWCSFLVVQDAGDGEFTLSEEDDDEEEHDGGYDDEGAKQTQLRYEFCAPSARRDGSIRLLRVEAAPLRFGA